MKRLYFATLPNNLDTISDLSTDKMAVLSNYIGETLSSLMRDRTNVLTQVKIEREDCFYIAHRRFNDITLDIYPKIDIYHER